MLEHEWMAMMFASYPTLDNLRDCFEGSLEFVRVVFAVLYFVFTLCVNKTMKL